MEKEDPRIQVQGPGSEGRRCRNFGHGTSTLEFSVISSGGIITDKVNGDTNHKGHNSWDDANGTPSLFGRIIGRREYFLEQWKE